MDGQPRGAPAVGVRTAGPPGHIRPRADRRGGRRRPPWRPDGGSLRAALTVRARDEARGGCSRQSRALAGGSPPSRHGCRAPRVPPTGTRFAVPAVSWVPGCPDADRALVALSASSISVRVSSVRPSSVRGGWCGVRCPVSSAQCPVSGVRCPCPLVRTGEFVERGCGGSHTSRDRPGRVTYLTRGSLSQD
jgi:hypothetical protein